MRARFDVLTFAVLGLLSFAQADTYHYYDEPVKRGILGDILGKLSGDKNGKKGATAAAKTVTETVRQTITVGAAAVGGGLNQTVAEKTKTVTVTQAATGQKVGNGTVQNADGAMLSFVTTTVFGTGEAPTVTITALASTVTQQVTMTMVQMIACGTTQSAAVPASQASLIASSAAAVASSAVAVAPSVPVATTVQSVPVPSSAVIVANPASQIPSVFTSGAAQLASTAVVVGQVPPAAALPASSTSVIIPSVVTLPSSVAAVPVQATAVPVAASSVALGGNPAVAAPAVTASTMNPANIQGVNAGPTINLSGVSLNSVINLGALIQQTAVPTAQAQAQGNVANALFP